MSKGHMFFGGFFIGVSGGLIHGQNKSVLFLGFIAIVLAVLIYLHGYRIDRQALKEGKE